MGVSELVHEAGLAHAGLPHDGHELTTALARESERPADVLNLDVAADEARQPAGSGDMEPASLSAGSGERVDFDGLEQALDCDRPAGGDLNVAFNELQRRRGQ